MNFISQHSKCGALAFMMLAGISTGLMADAPPPLSKADATTILQKIGYSGVNLAYLEPSDNPPTVHVVGMGNKEKKIAKIDLTFHYDADLGWFYSEFKEEHEKGVYYEKPAPASIKIWNLKGLTEITPGKATE